MAGSLDSTLRRLTLDLRRRAGRAEVRLARSCDLPRVAPSSEGESYRRAWMVGHSSDAAARSSPPDRVLSVDVEQGRCAALDLGPDRFPSEPVPVPKAQSASEHDVWLLVDVYDARTHATHLAIFDGMAAADAGPIARVWFDHHVPPSFHGTWVPRSG